MNFVRFVLAAGLCALSIAATAQTAVTAKAVGKKTYIVELADAPAATYSGGVQGLDATVPAKGAKLNAGAPNVRAYIRYLNGKRNQTLATVRGARVLHRYNLAFNGFAAQLTEAQARALKTSANVLSVVESERRVLDTISTPGFLGINAPGGLWSQLDAASRDVKGEDVIIGVIDSGIWPENPSFGDKVDGSGNPVAYNVAGTPAYGAPPKKWKGVCQTGEAFTAEMCNNKVIGARFYNSSFLSSGAVPIPLEYASPRDGGGHGTHTGSTAGGNANAPASVDGVATGTMSGIAPRARIAAYKVCWEATEAARTGCYTADTLKAIDDAVNDGVDVINYSISGTQTNFADPVEIAFLNASTAGVFVAASAGNSGPGNQVAHISPWLMTVAASTHDRYTVASVTLGAPSGAVFSGPSYQQSGLADKQIVRSIDVSVGDYASMSQTDKTATQRCYLPADGGNANTAIDPAKAAGKVVVCYRGGNVLINKAALVKQANGAGMLLQNVPAVDGTGPSATTTILQPYVVPTVHLATDTYAPINDYILAQGAAATVSFGPGVLVPGVVAPVMAGFSSRGPNKANGNILKPDISGPGVDIIAGYIDNSLTQTQHDAMLAGTYTPMANAASLQGTSMSSPHVAGAAALLKQLYPSWTPSAIKSALMTSTTNIKLADGTTDLNRWGYGAGHMNPNAAAAPVLVYDATPSDYGRFLCGLGLASPTGIGSCAMLGSVPPWNLNLASLTASNVPGTLTMSRHVTNVSNATKTFTSSATLPGGWTVSVSPSTLTLPPGGIGNFNVTVTRTSAALNTWSFGSLVWSDGVTQVRSPLSARAVGFSAPAQVTDVRASGRGSKLYSVVSSYTGSMSLAATGLVPATRSENTVATGAAQCYDFPVAAGAQIARFQLFNSDTQGGSSTDLDLDVFNGPGGTGTRVGSSGSATSDEIVTLSAPAAGTYSACVIGYSTPAGGAAYALSSWVVGPAVGAQTLRASAPAMVYSGGTASIALGWSVPAGKRYLGNVQYFDNTAAPIGSTIVYVDNH